MRNRVGDPDPVGLRRLRRRARLEVDLQSMAYHVRCKSCDGRRRNGLSKAREERELVLTYDAVLEGGNLLAHLGRAFTESDYPGHLYRRKTPELEGFQDGNRRCSRPPSRHPAHLVPLVVVNPALADSRHKPLRFPRFLLQALPDLLNREDRFDPGRVDQASRGERGHGAVLRICERCAVKTCSASSTGAICMICSDLRASLMINKGRRSPCKCGPGRERLKEQGRGRKKKQRQDQRTDRQAVKAEQCDGTGGVDEWHAAES